MGVGPKRSSAFNSILPCKAKDAARPAPATALDVFVECDQMKMGVGDVVARLVVNRRYVPGYTICQCFGVGPDKGNALICAGLARQGDDEPFDDAATALRG